MLAQDGRRDTIRCGTNSQRWLVEQDVVYADFSDRVADDCEIVYWPAAEAPQQTRLR